MTVIMSNRPSQLMHPVDGGYAGHQYEVVSLKKGCCESTFQAGQIQNIMNQQAAAGREFVWMQHESQKSCCSQEDCLLLVFKL